MTKATKPQTEERTARNAYMRDYSMRPDVKAKRQAREMTPEARAKKNAARSTPEKRSLAAERRRKWVATEAGGAKAKSTSLKQRCFTLGLWKELIKLQGNACAICRVEFKGIPREINADHCHDEMQPRGLLCKTCNTVEGFIKKSGLTPIEYGRRIEAYLANPPAQAAKRVSHQSVGVAGSKELS